MVKPPSIPADARAEAPSPTPGADPATAPSLEERAATLMDELAEVERKEHRAVLQWELGRLAEKAGDTAGAVKAYLTAYNHAPQFRPPLFDLIRIFERRRSFKNLTRLYDAELKSARSEADRASAEADLAAILEDRQGDGGAALEHLERATRREGGPAVATAGLFLERSARRAADGALVAQALAARARSATDPVWKALLLVDLADERAEGVEEGALDAAMAALDEALELGVVRFRVLSAMERLARAHDRPADLVRALEGLAELAAQAARGEEGEGSGAFSVQRFVDERRAAGRAAALHLEAATLRLHRLEDAAGAAEQLGLAVALRPDDAFLRLALVEAAARAGQNERVEEQAEALLAKTGPSEGEEEEGARESPLGPDVSAALLYHAARAAAQRGDEEAALARLREVLERAPESTTARVTADAWHLAGGHLDEWVDVLAARSGPDEDRAAALWRAATLAAQELGDFGRAKPLYEQASLHAPDPTPILRSLHEAAREAGDDAAAADAIAALLGREVDPEERSALLHERVGLLKANGEDEAGRDPTKAALTHALGVEAARAWAADAARVHAAEAGDHALLAKAHLALAERAVEEELTAAHRVAAARALARGGDDEAAIEELRGALERSPGHPYAVALLEQIYRSRGEADEVVRLLREAAAAHTGSRAALVELLLAGAAAEAAGDTSVAAETYEEAADLAPEAVSPLWALERLASKTGDDELLLRAREGLSEREIAVDAPARATLELGEHYAHVDKPGLAEGPLRGALESPVGPEAAASLALLPEDRADPMARVAGLRVLAALPEDGARLSRELGATAEVDALDPAVAEDAAKALLAQSDDEETEDDLWALLNRIASATADGDFATRAELLLRLAGRTRDRAAGSDLTLHALRAKIVAEGAEATDDAFLLAQELAYDAHGTAVGAVAADETLEAGDDPDTRADALLGRLVHTADATRSSLVAAAGRALAAARRPEAVARLREVLESDPHDLASWEALRVAARDQGEWEDVVRACDTLADALEGADRHEMREEAAAALMDHLDRPDEAEQRLREVVEADRSRPNAYFRLHDLLVDRGDEDALLELVEKRIHAIDDGAQLERLFYEKARLHRSRGELDAALEAIENLVMLDEQHVGGIALAVEIHVSREDWRAAVEGLRQIAAADVPAKQKRISLLGAADFLEHKLDDASGALDQLREVERLGLADGALYRRMADVAVRAGRAADAADVMVKAAEQSEGERRAALFKRAGQLQAEALSLPQAAVQSYEAALAVDPTDLDAARAVAELLQDPARRERHARQFEHAVRERIAHEGLALGHLRMLLPAARWAGDAGLERALLQALVALGEANEEERRASEEDTAILARPNLGQLGEERLAMLRAPADGGPELELARLVDESLCVALGLEPGSLGAGRGEILSPRKPHPLRSELEVLAGFFGVEVGDVYHGGDDAGRILGLPGKKGRASWVVGSGVRAPLDPLRRFLAGQQAYGLHRGVSALLRRAPQDGATLLFAAAAAADVPLAAGRDRHGVVEWARRLTKAMPRKVRKAVAQLAPTLADGGAGLEPLCRDVRRSAMRSGLLVGGELGLVLEALLDEPPRVGTVRAAPEAYDLLLFSLSPAMIELRRGLGA